MFGSQGARRHDFSQEEFSERGGKQRRRLFRQIGGCPVEKSTNPKHSVATLSFLQSVEQRRIHVKCGRNHGIGELHQGNVEGRSVAVFLG